MRVVVCVIILMRIAIWSEEERMKFRSEFTMRMVDFVEHSVEEKYIRM